MFLGIGIGVTAAGTAPDTTAPTITSNSTANCAENAQLAHALTANEPVTWSITGGVDAARFEISGSTLRWAGNGTKNFEAPNDFNTNNTYIVNVRATDLASNVADQTVTITVTNVLEVTLAALSLDDLTIAEDQPEGTKVGTITGATSGSSITLHAQSNAGMFAKDGNDIEVGATPLDFETVPSPTITLRETHADASNSPRDSVIGITVTDVAEGPSLGPELLVNGNFATDSDWQLDAGDNVATISGGKLRGSASGPSFAFQEPVITPTGTFRVVYTIDPSSVGNVTASTSTASGAAHSAPGTYSEDIAGTNGDAFNLLMDDAAIIDDASVKQVL